MIKQFIEKVFGRKKKAVSREPEPVIVKRGGHHIERDAISRAALQTCEGLQRAGFKAFVVGGAVRDLLLGMHPKDYDVATDATPEQVRNVFRRSRIIGRRFRLVHVMFGGETIEVSTFRGHFEREPGEESTDEHGRVLSDNVFGSQAEDALRRDFTVNALFYDPVHEEVWDFVHGLKDLQHKSLRMIGDAETRYREDPVRMLRAARLSGKLGFAVEKKTAAPIERMKHLLENVPQARLFDEILKLLLSGNSVACVKRLRELGLHHGLLPLLDTALDDPEASGFALRALESTDQRVKADKPVNPAFVLAALLWHRVDVLRAKAEANGLGPTPALHEAMHEALDDQRDSLAIPRRFDAVMKEIWLMQPRFLRRGGSAPFRLLEQPRFRAAYDFLALRAQAGDAPAELGEWWDNFQSAGDEARRAMLVKDAPGSGGRKRKRRRGGRKNSGDKSVDNTAHPTPSGEE